MWGGGGFSYLPCTPVTSRDILIIQFRNKANSLFTMTIHTQQLELEVRTKHTTGSHEGNIVLNTSKDVSNHLLLTNWDKRLNERHLIVGAGTREQDLRRSFLFLLTIDFLFRDLN